MKSKRSNTVSANRSSITGRFVTEHYAKKHTPITEHERFKRKK